MRKTNRQTITVKTTRYPYADAEMAISMAQERIPVCGVVGQWSAKFLGSHAGSSEFLVTHAYQVPKESK